jgi:hypothetical protein
MINPSVIPMVAAILVGVFVNQACADAGLPAPQLDLNLIFKNLDEFPDHDFYLKYERKFGQPARNLNKLEQGVPIHLGGRRSGIGPVVVLALPRGQDVNAPANAERLQSKPLKADAAGAALTQYSGYDITYRVRIDGDELDVEWVASSLNSFWSTARVIAILIGVACLLAPVALVALVILLIRRLRKKDAAVATELR